MQLVKFGPRLWTISGRTVDLVAKASLFWDTAEADPAVSITGNLDSYYKKIRVVGLTDDGTINKVIATYDNPVVSDADTDGSQGQVMVEFPKLWYKNTFDGDGHLNGIDLASYSKSGYELHPCFSWGDGRDYVYIAAYEASAATTTGVLRSISGANVLHSRNISQFRGQAELRGSGWHLESLWTDDLWMTLFYHSFQSRNSRLVLPGYVNANRWNTADARLTGRSNILETINGSVDVDLLGLDSDLSGVLASGNAIANRFLWIENIFGHFWKFKDGYVYVPSFDFDAVTNSLTPSGNMWNDDWGLQLQSVYHTPDIRLFSSVSTEIRDTYTRLDVTPLSVATTASIQKVGRGFIPTSGGGNTVQNFCATMWSYLPDTARPYLRVVRAGGYRLIGAHSGVAARYVPYGLADSASSFVARLCFSKI